GGFGSRFACKSSAVTSHLAPPGGSLTLALQRIAFTTMRRNSGNAPVRVKVSAGEAKTPAAVGALDRPGECLVVRRFFRKHRCQDRCDAVIIRAEADQVIPFVFAGEALPAA